MCYSAQGVDLASTFPVFQFHLWELPEQIGSLEAQMWIRFGFDRTGHGPLVVFSGVWHPGLGGRSFEFSVGLAPMNMSMGASPSSARSD